jgi:hypothetical protein
VIGIPLGLAAANAAEWAVHKYVLHGLGRKRSSLWSFHWHEHHRNSRRHGFVDPTYHRSLWGWNAQSKEALGLVLGGAASLSLFPLAPFFSATLVYSTVNYYRKHKRGHEDPAWAREHIPWHYDHHMGPEQDKNWCVTRPWFDRVMGTRVPYAGTEREARDLERRRRRRQVAAQARTSRPMVSPWTRIENSTTP